MIALDDIRTETDLVTCLRMRRQAEALLDRLMKNRTRTEQYHRDHGTMDPMRTVTGRTAIDNAIDHTKEILRNLDRVIQSDQEADSFETDCAGLSRLRRRA
ncbi:MAG: hypothetical protein P8K80_06940 [Phycisphaerales bacterium]|nr:hypothetical protein [Phycisphaerales bacterium]